MPFSRGIAAPRSMRRFGIWFRQCFRRVSSDHGELASEGGHRPMPKATPATQALRKLGIAFKLHTYIYDSTVPSGGFGLQAAEALGVEPSRMLKTLMAEVDGNPVCVVVPSDCEGRR